MTMFGADVAALEAAVTSLTTAADALDADAKDLQRTLAQVEWLGPIATTFKSSFERQHHASMLSTASFIRDAAARLKAQAEQQRQASGSGAEPATMTAAPTIAPAASTPAAQHERLQSEQARRFVMDKADRMLANTMLVGRFPQAMAELQQWRESLGDGVPSAEDVARIERYLAAVNMANYQYNVVKQATQMAIDEFVEMARAAGSAVGGAAGLEPEGVAGTLLSGATDLVMGGVDANVISPNLAQLSELNTDQYAALAAAGMGEKLRGMASSAQSTDVVMHNDPTKVALTSYQASMSDLDVASSTGDIASAFDIMTGDGSVVDSVLRTSMKLVPGAGQVAGRTLDVAAIAGASAQANYHAQAGGIALAVAAGAIQDFDHFTAKVVDL